MSDNVEASPGTGGAIFASDDIAGVQHPRTKLEWGPDGTANETDDATTGTVVSILYDTNNFVGVTLGSENLTLKAGSALLLQGASRAAEAAPFDYLTDIRGQARPLVAGDVGPFHISAPAAVPRGHFIEG